MGKFAIAALFLGMAGGVWGQQSVTLTCPSEGGPNGCVINKDGKGMHCTDKAIVAPAPLKCGKYEHVEYGTLRCPHNGQGLPKDVCEWSTDDRSYCADNMHSVTEKEWQHLSDAMKVDEETIRSLMDKIKTMQASGKYLWWCKPGKLCVRVFGDEIWVSRGSADLSSGYSIAVPTE